MSEDKITVMGKVTYKQIVTPAYKEKAIAEVDEQLKQIDEELSNFDKQMDKTITELTLKAHPQIEALRQQFNLEREKIVVYREQMEASKQTVVDMEEGIQVPAGEGNFVSELSVGDAFDAKLSCEVIVENDRIIAINRK